MSPWRVAGPAAGYESGVLKRRVCSWEFLDKREPVQLVGSAGAGKNFLAQALGYSADHAGHTVHVIIDDLGLYRLTAHQSVGLYEPILNRHRASSFVIASNRGVGERLSLFDDPILGNSVLDRLANASYQIVIDGTSYREPLSPHRALLGAKGGD